MKKFFDQIITADTIAALIYMISIMLLFVTILFTELAWKASTNHDDAFFGLAARAVMTGVTLAVIQLFYHRQAKPLFRKLSGSGK